MALFPRCGFKVLLPKGAVTPGEQVDGMLVLTVPEAIPRAEHLDLFFRSTAIAGYGSGKSRSVYRRDLFVVPLRVDLAKDTPLAVGEHRFPFALDVPSWLPPHYNGADCAIRHAIEARLDVDWAIDPKATLVPLIALQPLSGQASPLTTRSPAGLHESLVVELTLDSAVIAQNEPLTGRLALRAGHGARFDAITVTVRSSATLHIGRGDRRSGSGTTIRIPADRLRRGESVPFLIPPNADVPPTFRNGFIDHDVVVSVTVDIPWALDPSFEVALTVLPPGSVVHRNAAEIGAVGAERLHAHATHMAQATGLRRGALPTLVEGSIGPVAVRVTDGPRSGRLGVDVDFTFPDLDLGIVFRPLGLLDGFRQSPLLPPPLGDRYLLRVEPGRERPAVEGAPLGAFVASVLGDLRDAEEIRFSDQHLGIHVALANDSSSQMVDLARFVSSRARSIATAISALPFPAVLQAARPAWEATAVEQGAFLVPHAPALHGLTIHARVAGGEPRTMPASILTEWRPGERGGPASATTLVDLDLRGAPLPKGAWAEIERDASDTSVAGLRAVRAVFPIVRVETQEKVTLECPAWTPDPRALLATIELFFWWVLDARGERRADAPYR